MDEKRVAEVYDELSVLVVELDPDPVARGPGYLQDLIAKVRGYLNRVSVFTQEAHRERHGLERQRDGLQAAFDVEADRLLSEDKRVARQPNIDDRKAMINLIMSEERREIQQVERELRSLGHVEKAIRHRQKELESTMSAIRLQRSLIQAELRTGSFYGDETETSRGDAWGKKSSQPTDDLELDPEELSALVAEAERQIQAEAGDSEPGEDDGEEFTDELADEISQLVATAESQVEVVDEAKEPEKEPELEGDPAIDKFLNEDDDDFDGLFDDLG